jgi:hypothetical protein
MEFEASFIIAERDFPELRGMYVQRYQDALQYTLRQSRVYIDSDQLLLHRSQQSASFVTEPRGAHCLLHKRNVAIYDGYVAREERKLKCSDYADVQAMVDVFQRSVGLSAPLAPRLVLVSERRNVVVQTVPQPVFITFDVVDAYATDNTHLLRFYAVEFECNGERADDRFLREVAGFRERVSDAVLLHSSKYSHSMSSL